MTEKNYNCWGCKYFKAGPSQTIPSGWCRRHAPMGLDAVGLLAAKDTRKNRAGNIGEDIIIGGAGQLYRSGDATIGLPCVPAGQGFNQNGAFPFVTVPGETIDQIEISISLMNVGTAQVGADPKLLLNFVEVRADTSEVIQQIEIDVDPASVGVAGNETDNYKHLSYNFGALGFQMPITNWGIQFDLSETDDNRIAEIRNPNVCVITQAPQSSSSSLYKFAWIPAALTMQCGEHCPSNVPVPDPPSI
jgi:hypothetical protein